MQRGEVDMCIVGTDRTLSNGDVCNKIGTYLKALAAHDNRVPFYVALPSSTIDWNIKDYKKIPIEERKSEELSYMEGLAKTGVNDNNNNRERMEMKYDGYEEEKKSSSISLENKSKNSE